MDSTVTITGNLTQNPELKFLGSGQAAARFSVAVNRKWKDRSGVEQEQTSYFDVQTYGTLAENCANSLEKGTRVVVTGRLEQRSWETDEGTKRSVVEINADEVAPSLRWANATVTKTGSNAGTTVRSAPRATVPNFNDEPF